MTTEEYGGGCLATHPKPQVERTARALRDLDLWTQERKYQEQKAAHKAEKAAYKAARPAPSVPWLLGIAFVLSLAIVTLIIVSIALLS